MSKSGHKRQIRQIRAEFSLAKFTKLQSNLKQENVDDASNSREIYDEELS